jgi:NAD(P)-dependent dehydrogenase (short-subunit alcohol dehydrogenase family)
LRTKGALVLLTGPQVQDEVHQITHGADGVLKGLGRLLADDPLLVGIPGAAAYAGSKAAVRNQSKSVALDCAEQGWKIRCNSIHPAAIRTLMCEPMLGKGVDREERVRKQFHASA